MRWMAQSLELITSHDAMIVSACTVVFWQSTSVKCAILYGSFCGQQQLEQAKAQP